jgi:hypothetical protein
MNRIVEAVMSAQAISVERKMREARIAAAQRETRWSGPRSLLILALLSSVMFGLLAVGALAG